MKDLVIAWSEPICSIYQNQKITGLREIYLIRHEKVERDSFITLELDNSVISSSSSHSGFALFGMFFFLSPPFSLITSNKYCNP